MLDSISKPWFLCLLVVTQASLMGQPAATAPTSVGIVYSQSSIAEASYVANSAIKLGSTSLGEIDTTHFRVRYGVSAPASKRYSWRMGVEYERYSVGVPRGAFLPDTLQSVAVNLGNTLRVGDKWALQFEMDPGVYSDFEDMDWEDLNAPLSFRALYFHRPNLIWTLAVIGNIKSEFPIVGGIGARWLPTERLTVDVILPRPQVAYEASDRITLFAGGEFKGGGYRVAEDFGSRLGRPDLNDQDVFYREARVGGGFKCKLTEKVSAVLEGGWVIDRRFTYVDRNLQLNGDGAGYFQIAIRGRY